MPPQPKVERLAESWESFERAVIPADAGPVQRQEMRRAFYAGAWSILCSVRHIGGNDSISEQDGAAMLESLVRECERFKSWVGVYT
jgi:hypothetical protein